MSAYESFSLFSLAFAVVVVCLFVCLFHFSNKRDIFNFRIMAVRDIELHVTKFLRAFYLGILEQIHS